VRRLPGRHGAPTPPREVPIDHTRELRSDDRRRARRGAIELVAAAIVIAVLIAFAVWFFGFAHNPCCSP
jgi:hypothetical protein